MSRFQRSGGSRTDWPILSTVDGMELGAGDGAGVDFVSRCSHVLPR
jgi:hypothetical protein